MYAEKDRLAEFIFCSSHTCTWPWNAHLSMVPSQWMIWKPKMDKYIFSKAFCLFVCLKNEVLSCEGCLVSVAGSSLSLSDRCRIHCTPDSRFRQWGYSSEWKRQVHVDTFPNWKTNRCLFVARWILLCPCKQKFEFHFLTKEMKIKFSMFENLIFLLELTNMLDWF